MQQTLNLVLVEHAEGTNVLENVRIETVRVTPTPINSIQFSLGHNVSESLRMKIIEGKFVDLALLLKNSNIEDTVSERVLVVGNDGQMASISRSLVKITSTEKWTDAFLIFVSVFTSVHVSNFQDMLKYMHDVRTGADRSAGWKLYGEQFRFKIAMYPAKSWTSVDCVINCLMSIHVSNRQSYSAQDKHQGQDINKALDHMELISQDPQIFNPQAYGT